MTKPRLNVMFVCSRNQWRSPTAEKMYENDDRLNVRSRGTTRNAIQTITANDIKWSDVGMSRLLLKLLMVSLVKT